MLCFSLPPPPTPSLSVSVSMHSPDAHCEVTKATDVGLASVNKAVRKTEKQSVPGAVDGVSRKQHLPAPCRTVKAFSTLRSSCLPYGVRKGLGENVCSGWVWLAAKAEKAPKGAGFQACRGLSLHLVFGCIYQFIVGTHASYEPGGLRSHLE